MNWGIPATFQQVGKDVFYGAVDRVDYYREGYADGVVYFPRQFTGPRWASAFAFIAESKSEGDTFYLRPDYMPEELL